MDTKMNETGSAFRGHWLTKINRYTEAQHRTGQLEDHTSFSERIQYVEDGKNTSYLGGFGRGSMEVKFHLAEIGLRVFQEVPTTWTKVTEAAKCRAHFGEQCIWFDCNIVSCLGIMPKGCLLASENRPFYINWSLRERILELTSICICSLILCLYISLKWKILAPAFQGRIWWWWWGGSPE